MESVFEDSNRIPSALGPSSQALALHPRSARINVGQTERAVSAAAGAALFVLGLLRRGVPGRAAEIAGAALLVRGATGRCAVYRRLQMNSAEGQALPREAEMARSITVAASPEEIREVVRGPMVTTLLPFLVHFEPHGQTIRLGARIPRGPVLRWNAAIEEDASSITWRSEPKSAFGHELRLAFEAAPGDRGTQLHATLRVRAPAGAAGAAIAQWFRGLGARGLGAALARLKQWIETGELATTDRQPNGRRTLALFRLASTRRQEAER